MHHLLEKLLRKQQIEDTSQLSADEQQTYDHWQKVLSGGELTIEKIAEFCQSQIAIIENQFKNLDNSQQKSERLVLLYTVYKSLIDVIKAPEAEKENLEKYLQQLLTK